MIASLLLFTFRFGCSCVSDKNAAYGDIVTLSPPSTSNFKRCCCHRLFVVFFVLYSNSLSSTSVDCEPHTKWGWEHLFISECPEINSPGIIDITHSLRLLRLNISKSFAWLFSFPIKKTMTSRATARTATWAFLNLTVHQLSKKGSIDRCIFVALSIQPNFLTISLYLDHNS